MENEIEMTPANETTERPVEKIVPRAGVRVRAAVHVGEAEYQREEMEEDSGLPFLRYIPSPWELPSPLIGR